MALVKLSSKGQLVLPKAMREALAMGPGAILKINRKGRRIVIEPVATSVIEHLYGKFSQEGLLEDLEAEHHEELLRENRS